MTFRESEPTRCTILMHLNNFIFWRLNADKGVQLINYNKSLTIYNLYKKKVKVADGHSFYRPNGGLGGITCSDP